MCSQLDEPGQYDLTDVLTCDGWTDLGWRCTQVVALRHWTDFQGMERLACPSHFADLKRKWPASVDAAAVEAVSIR